MQISRFLSLVLVSCAILPVSAEETQKVSLAIGFAKRAITPDVNREGHPVWLAGYSAGRKATGVHDPLNVRAAVLTIDGERVAFAAADLIGLQLDVAQRIRAKLSGFRHITIHSTHNHEGPDVIGIWGKTLFQRGVDPEYIDLVVERTVEAIEEAASRQTSVVASYGTAEDDSLLDDHRLPVVKDGILRLLSFHDKTTQRPAGLIVQWNCHPETLGAHNTLVTADFPAATIDWLEKKHGCPVLYVSGTVGGLMAPPRDRIRGTKGDFLNEGEFEFATRYGEEVAQLAQQALEKSAAIRLDAPVSASVPVALHVENRLYRLARRFGVLHREAFEWKKDPFAWGEKLVENEPGSEVAVLSEVSYLRLGQLHWVNIPGEIYPELVYGRSIQPVDAGADLPDAPAEASLTSLLPNQKWILCGLANDEIGYIIPRRQWDIAPPYCHSLERAQYGEMNSCGPATAPIIMQGLQRCIQEAQQTSIATVKP